MKFLEILLMILISASFTSRAFANVSDTVCDVDGQDISFDIGSSTPADTGSRPFYALEIGKKGQVTGKGIHQIMGSSPLYKTTFIENQGDFTLKITSVKSHRLVFYAEKKTAPDSTVKTNASSSIIGFSFPRATFNCH